MSTVFWSWQSDLDARVTRDVVRDALLAAIKELSIEIEERHELTSDTKGVAGSPDIVATILEKIDAAAVFVADVTPIANSPTGKAVANPNVLIELGYAKKSLGLQRIIQVWNTAFDGAKIEHLPFDMRGRRSPLSYNLAPGSTTEELRAARHKLSLDLKEALRASIASIQPEAPLGPNWQPALASTSALWFDPTTPLLINDSGSAGSKQLAPGPYAYVRIVPSSWSIPANFADGSPHPIMLGPTQGYSWGMVRGGFLVYNGSIRASENRELRNFAIQFRATGEIWGVSTFVVSDDGKRFFADAFISHAYDFIEANVKYLTAQQASGPYHVRMGVAPIEGTQWTSETRWGGQSIALEDRAQGEFMIGNDTEEEILNKIIPAWADLASAYGVPAPTRPIIVRQIRGY
jgi:hypothetical protein